MTSVIPAEGIWPSTRVLRRTPGSAGRERIRWPLGSPFFGQSQPSAQALQRCADRRLGGNSEMLVELLGGRAGAEAVHAYKCAIVADHRIPAPPDRGLDRDLDRGIADDRLLLPL